MTDSEGQGRLLEGQETMSTEQGTMSTTAEPGCAGDRNNYGFTNIEKMRFRTLTYEIIEELRMRRDQDVENESKIQQLLQDKFELGKKLDVEVAKLANKEEQHDMELRETKRQMEDKIREVKIDSSQQQVARKIAEKETEALKDEIRQLQLTNYSLQKQIRDHERHEKVQTSEREQHIRQMSQFENQFKQVTSLTKELGTKQTKLETDMKEIEHLNHLLRYQNLHNKCIIKLKNGDITQLQDQIVSSAVSEKTDVRGEREKERELTREITLLKEKLNNTQKHYDTLAEDAQSWKTKYWDSLKTLEEAHRLVNVSLHNSAQYKKELEASEEVNRATEEKLENTEGEVTDVRGQLETATEEREKAEEEWRNTKSELEEEIKKLNDDLVSEREKYTHLEAVNTQTNDNVEELNRELKKLKAILNRERCEFSTQTELSLLSVTDKNIQTCTEFTNKEVQTDAKDISCCYVQTINPALHSSEAQTDQAELTETDAQTDPTEVTETEAQTDTTGVTETEAQTDTAVTVSTVSQTDIQLEDEISKNAPDLSTKGPPTNIAAMVHTFVQTEPIEADTRIDHFTEEGKQNEALPVIELHTYKHQNHRNSTDNEMKISIDQVSSRPICESKEVTELEDEQRVARSLQGIDPDWLNVNIGISARDMNIRATGDNLTEHVIVDPEDYALTLTQEQPITAQDTQACDADVKCIPIGRDSSDDDVTRNIIGQENKAEVTINDSDEDDFVAPTQLSKRLKNSREDNVETTPGPLKHKLSLSERLKHSFGNTSLLASTEREADCSSPKQLKYSECEHVGNDDSLTAYENITDKNLDSLSFPTEMNRIVARSGQKLEKVVKTPEKSSEKLKEASGKILRSESSFKERNLPSRVLRTEKDKTFQNYLRPGQLSLNSHTEAASKRNQGKLQLPHHKTPEISLNLPVTLEPIVAQDKVSGSVNISTRNASKSGSEASSINPRYLVSQPTRSYPSSSTMGISVKPVSSTLSSMASSSASNKTASGIPSPSSLSEPFSTTSSSGQTAAASIVASTRSQSSTVPAAGGDSEPSFLIQKYREIVAKINPTAALQPQGTKKPGTTKKGKQLYTGSHTPAIMLPTPLDPDSEEGEEQFSADSLNTRNSLRGILKGGAAKEKGNKNVSWNA